MRVCILGGFRKHYKEILRVIDIFDIIFLMAVIHNFPLKDANLLLNKIYSWLKNDGYLVIGTSVHNIEEYSYKIKKYRHQYTKQSFEKLIKKNNFHIFKSYIVEEKDRNKKWYDLICRKVSKGNK